ncbi:hypothetical protein BWQ96_06717 [Gracilariopsis chorda]|uniref:Uncharacterized protein n=1 Tax=Gracilariopsis chorda TaxID=448386 RepID=A0A2V3IQW1_9FLOR|nr:hypothetical protein BWQ96_06717 [Gracilariopsis chorda]|eukprot:PXF43540.1 hypothetical protein BWQ96_06717 [Gracilariopsis chorda]
MEASNEREAHQKDSATAKTAKEEAEDYKVINTDIHQLMQLLPKRAILGKHLNKRGWFRPDKMRSRVQEVASSRQMQPKLNDRDVENQGSEEATA